MTENSKEKVIRIARGEADYPESLYRLDDGPKELFCLGNTEIMKTRCLAVVGSRKCSEYGKRVAMKIGEECAANGVTAVSGMAKGIDSFAQLGALNGGGTTVAVLGTGVDVCYPRENLKLYGEIKEKGLIISEFPPGSEPLPYRFPLRNRIIAGLSEAVVVVEAGIKSGSLITAELAAAQGKDVFAVPGNITSFCSIGTNKLLTDGAKAISVVDDIFYDMGIQPALRKDEEEELGNDEREVYDLVKKRGELTIDYVCAFTGRTPAHVSRIVTVLEMKGMVGYSLGKIFSCKI